MNTLIYDFSIFCNMNLTTYFQACVVNPTLCYTTGPGPDLKNKK